jgi:hypothetical protein
MVKKSLLALLLAYVISVLPPLILDTIFSNGGPPSDAYSSLDTFSTGLYTQIGICVFILLLFGLRKILSQFFKIDEVIYFHFLFYLFFYNAANLYLLVQSKRSELFYTISGARKIKDPVYGYVYPSNTQRHETVYYADSLLLEADYTFDSLGRRYTPQDHIHKQRSTLFFGCSFTYGDGVNDAETLPAQYASLDTNSDVFNYAIDGWGPQQTLQELTHRDLIAETNSDTALGIYVWIDDHLKRAALFKSHYFNWTQYFPCFILQGDSLLYKGNFESAYPYRAAMFKLLDHSIFLKNIDIPSHVSNYDYQLSCAILRASQKAFLRQFKSGRFIVLIYPGSDPELIPYLKRAGLDYISCDKVELGQSDFIPRHGHPNKAANKKLSKFLFESVNLSDTIGIEQ